MAKNDIDIDRRFSPEGDSGSGEKASATGSLYILVGLALTLGHCITVFELG